MPPVTTYLVSRAPLRATRKQVQALRGVLPGLARVDVDLLELALDLVPTCILAWSTPEAARQIVAELAMLGLEVQALDEHALVRLELGCPSQPALAQACFSPAFIPPFVVRATRSIDARIELRLWTAREPLDHDPIGARIQQGLELDDFRPVEVLAAAGWLDASACASLLEALAALHFQPDPALEPRVGRDGMDVELRTLDERGEAHVELAWSPEPAEAPRLHAFLVTLLRACAGLELTPSLARRLADLRRYL